MIYIVEIPHQMPAKCWSRDTRDEILSVVNEIAIRSGEMCDGYDSAIDWLGSDLHAIRVYESDAEALAALGEYSGHQSGAAESALRDELTRNGAIKPVDTENVEALRDERAPLYRHYTGQTQAQPAFVELAGDGHVSARHNSEIGNGVPMAVWHGRDLRFSITNSISGSALADLVTSDPVASLLARIHAGHSIEWDGSNRVGCLTTDARAAADELSRRFEEVEPDVVVWDASDWLFSANRLIDVWGGGDLTAVVAALESDVKNEPQLFLDGDIRECLLCEARRYVDNDDPGLTADHLTALVAAGEISQEQADAYAAENL